MWKLKRIYAKNLCAFKELDYSLEQGHTTLVFGNNLDNDSQVSNGSGKSALIEAIAIGLTGETLRKIKMEEIINDAEDMAEVQLNLYNDATGKYFSISRVITRKTPQAIGLEFTDESETKEIKQPSVADYNKFILETLGLTKDDIFANYILSKHKYSSFLSSSDREKKEIINRFSNGIIVDESIAKLQEDMSPIQEELREAEAKVNTCTGSVTASDEAIQTAIQESTERSKTKAQRIENWKSAIKNKRAFIREQGEIVKDLKTTVKALDGVYNRIADIEEGDGSFEDCYDNISILFKSAHIDGLRDFKAESVSVKQKLSQLQKDLSAKNDELKAHAMKCSKQEKAYRKLEREYGKFISSYDGDLSSVNERIEKLAESIKSLNQSNAELIKKRSSLNSRLSSIKNILEGVIVCPKCKHEFLLDPNADLESLRNEANEKSKEIVTVSNDIEKNQEDIESYTKDFQKERDCKDALIDSKSDWSSKVTDSKTELDNLARKASTLRNDLGNIGSDIASLQKDIDDACADMFDSAFGIVDELTNKAKSKISQCNTEIENANGAIKSYEESINEIEHSAENDLLVTLKASKEKYEKELTKAISKKEEVERKLAAYKKQEATFIEFKTYLANMKIDALSQMTNEFLEAIGSDIRISFSGFTVLKSGKIRDKISISLIRDGVDCGSFDKFSEGEKARANLANILALHKLTNVNCPDDNGLDLLVLDEILEACDEAGLANMFEALNKLQITSLVVSHGNIAENYPYKLIVNKKNDISFINGN